MKTHYRDSVMEIDLDKVRHNIRVIINETNDGKFLYGVVKGDAYGYGILEISRIVIEEGCDGIAVATLDEAMIVRKYFKDIPILVLGTIRKEDVIDSAIESITITIPNLDFAQFLSSAILPKELKVHLKANTGMNRLGMNNAEELKQAIKMLQGNKNVNINGIFTHFATADYVNDSQKAYYENQLSKFKDILNSLNFPFEQIHCTNSASLLKFHKDFDFTTTNRTGWNFFAMTADDSLYDYDLLPCIKVKSKISHTFRLEKGDYIGYANTYEVTNPDCYYAVCPIGYADGIDQSLKGTKVRCNNQYGTIVGKICMDHLMIEFEKNINIGDEVYFIDGDDPEIDLFKRAEQQGCTNIAVMEKFTIRLPKVYYENNKLYKVDNALLNKTI